MTTQPPAGPPAPPLQPPYPPHSTDADWSSPLWARPDTVATGWAPAPVEPPVALAPALPPAKSRRASRAVVAATTAVLLVIGVLSAFFVHDALTRPVTDAAAASPSPSISAPAVPAPTPSPSLPDPGNAQPAPVTPGTPGGQDLTADQQAAAAAVSPGLVDIVSTIGYDGSQGAGTGVVLTSDGIVLTNHHVVAGSTSLSVTDVGNGQTYTATVLGYDRSHDVAVIKLADASGLQTAPLGDSSTVRVGDSVVAVGNALGKGGAPSAVAGTVTDLDQSITAMDSTNGTAERLSGLIQVDAAILPGDSGGALVDTNREVVGLITAASVSGGGPQSTPTEGFAIPLATAKAIADDIVAGRGSASVHIGGTAFLGVQIAGVGNGATGNGVLVAGAVPGSSADRAGIDGGDVITAVDGTAVRSGEALKTALADHRPGDRVTVRWVDLAGTSHTASVTLTDGPTG